MNIRRATPADTTVIAQFNTNLARETEGVRLDAATITSGVAALLNDPTKGLYFVAETPGTGVVGQLMITYEWSDWRNANMWWIQSVYVKQEFRGQGVFKSLVDHVVELAQKTEGVCLLRLYMHKDNDRARHAYHKLGLVESGHEVFEMRLSKSNSKSTAH